MDAMKAYTHYSKYPTSPLSILVVSGSYGDTAYASQGLIVTHSCRKPLLAFEVTEIIGTRTISLHGERVSHDRIIPYQLLGILFWQTLGFHF